MWCTLLIQNFLKNLKKKAHADAQAQEIEQTPNKSFLFLYGDLKLS